MTPFLLILIFWLTVIFISFSLFVEPGAVVVAALLIFALSVSSGLFLIADLSQPFAGLMQISSEPLQECARAPELIMSLLGKSLSQSNSSAVSTASSRAAGLRRMTPDRQSFSSLPSG